MIIKTNECKNEESKLNIDKIAVSDIDEFNTPKKLSKEKREDLLKKAKQSVEKMNSLRDADYEKLLKNIEHLESIIANLTEENLNLNDKLQNATRKIAELENRVNKISNKEEINKNKSKIESI